MKSAMGRLPFLKEQHIFKKKNLLKDMLKYCRIRLKLVLSFNYNPQTSQFSDMQKIGLIVFVINNVILNIS